METESSEFIILETLLQHHSQAAAWRASAGQTWMLTGDTGRGA